MPRKINESAFKMCFSLVNKGWKVDQKYSFQSFSILNMGGVYNKFIVITVTWSEVPDLVSLTGADH